MTDGNRTHLIRDALKPGLYGGITALFLSVIGMVQALQGRDFIVGILAIGQGLLVIIAVIAGYLTARRLSLRDDARPRALMVVAASLGSGALVGLFLSVLVAVATAINLRPVLINVSPELIDSLSLGVGGIDGATVPLAFGAALGGFGGALYLLPGQPRRILITGLLWLAFLGLISEILRISISFLPPQFTRQFVTTTGLRPLGATLIFVTVIGVTVLMQRWGRAIRQATDELPPPRKRMYTYGKWAFFMLILLILPWVVGRVASDVLVTVGIYVLMGFGLNIVVGKAGLLDLGYVAFFAVGAYTTAILTSADELPTIVLSFWLALPVVILVTGIAGLLIGAPVLRMRGDYLAIVTLGFGEIARFLALSDWLIPVIGGAQGVVQIPNVIIGGIELIGPQNLYYLILVFSLGALFVSWRLEDSRVGRAWVAMREDETVAEVMGVNTIYYKLLAFAMGAMIASLGGAVFAIKLSAIFPHSFNVIVSITTLSLLIIGGLGSLPGVIVGALALVGLPELLREFEDFRLLLYGAVLIIMMLVRPQGLVPSVRREREITEEELAQDAYFPASQPAAAPAGSGTSD